MIRFIRRACLICLMVGCVIGAEPENNRPDSIMMLMDIVPVSEGNSSTDSSSKDYVFNLSFRESSPKSSRDLTVWDHNGFLTLAAFARTLQEYVEAQATLGNKKIEDYLYSPIPRFDIFGPLLEKCVNKFKEKIASQITHQDQEKVSSLTQISKKASLSYGEFFKEFGVWMGEQHWVFDLEIYRVGGDSNKNTYSLRELDLLVYQFNTLQKVKCNFSLNVPKYLWTYHLPTICGSLEKHLKVKNLPQKSEKDQHFQGPLEELKLLGKTVVCFFCVYHLTYIEGLPCPLLELLK